MGKHCFSTKMTYTQKWEVLFRRLHSLLADIGEAQRQESGSITTHGMQWQTTNTSKMMRRDRHILSHQEWMISRKWIGIGKWKWVSYICKRQEKMTMQIWSGIYTLLVTVENSTSWMTKAHQQRGRGRRTCGDFYVGGDRNVASHQYFFAFRYRKFSDHRQVPSSDGTHLRISYGNASEANESCPPSGDGMSEK